MRNGIKLFRYLIRGIVASVFFFPSYAMSDDDKVYGKFPITVKGYSGNKTSSTAYTGQIARHILHDSLKKLAGNAVTHFFATQAKHAAFIFLVKTTNRIEGSGHSLSEDRRIEITKVAAKYAENAKIAVRNIRRDNIENTRKLQKNSEISEDQKHKNEILIQEITNEIISSIDDILSTKEKEILEN